jgi:hypothetical protein
MDIVLPMPEKIKNSKNGGAGSSFRPPGRDPPRKKRKNLVVFVKTNR